MIEFRSIPRDIHLLLEQNGPSVTFQDLSDKSPVETCDFSRRNFLRQTACQMGAVAASLTLPFHSGCMGQPAPNGLPPADLIIGQRGLSDGRFQKPRAMAIDKQDQLFVVDKTGRVQMFDPLGKFVRGWRTPEIESGKPTGISIDDDGVVIVADTHYYRFLFYTPEGELIEEKTIGGTNGSEPGQFAFVTDIVRAANGEYYCGEYGEFDRIHKYSSDGNYVDRMGEHGNEPLQFSRPQSFCVDQEGLLWVADSCNHRIQVIDWREAKPKSVAIHGELGDLAGQFRFPYGLALGKDNTMIVSEYGNHRVQKLDRTGKSLTSWGAAGSVSGALNQPWAAAIDSENRVYVVDSGNNRVQRFRF